MIGEEANRILDAAERTAGATTALFEALELRRKGELSDSEAVIVAHDYVVAKQDFDRAVETRGQLL